MGGKALLYFEVVTTLALFIGLGVVNWLRPGDGLPLDLSRCARAWRWPSRRRGWDIALHLFPSNLVKHAAEGDILPVVVFATLFGIALTRIGERGKVVRHLLRVGRAGDVQVHRHDHAAHAARRVRRDGLQREPHGRRPRGGRRGAEGLAGGAPPARRSTRSWSAASTSRSLVLFVLVFVPIMLVCGDPRLRASCAPSASRR